MKKSFQKFLWDLYFHFHPKNNGAIGGDIHKTSTTTPMMNQSSTSKKRTNLCQHNKPNHPLLTELMSFKAGVSKSQATKRQNIHLTSSNDIERRCMILFGLISLLFLYVGNFQFESNGINAPSMSSRATKRSIMVIATYPDSTKKFASVWSQLQCFSNEFDKIIISAPVQFTNETNDFLNQVYSSMPGLKEKTETSFHVNDRYDLGLWCDA